MPSWLCAEFAMCRVGYVPSLLCAELSHNRVEQVSTEIVALGRLLSVEVRGIAGWSTVNNELKRPAKQAVTCAAGGEA